MDLTYLKKLVRIVEQSGVDEIEVEEEGLRVRVAKNSHTNSSIAHAASAQAVASPPSQAVQGENPASQPAAPPATPEVKYHEVKSPIVGTFYRAPAPDAEEYIQVGQTVQPKTVLCIIEAMKLMNEIECDIAGRVVKILVENGQPVEYNQTLFLIEPV
ncbi:MAG: acetyl-CoA carboxylase biotin carboxyl carrier protein [Ignavibacteria bacterium]|nr:acetyl-CoA carboxylase biotin carboxyl carrier protein [Ignavibacteria bacterium]MBI3766758.1 acetyl-CoA carboxylase biotin carboxyl carrier protein [Ignavibacteriales bacterium]